MIEGMTAEVGFRIGAQPQGGPESRDFGTLRVPGRDLGIYLVRGAGILGSRDFGTFRVSGGVCPIGSFGHLLQTKSEARTGFWDFGILGPTQSGAPLGGPKSGAAFLEITVKNQQSG